MSHVMQYQPQWIREDFVDFIAEKINPVWAWKKVKASVVKSRTLSHDFYQIQLRPNRNFKHQQFKAGQSVLVTVEIAGVRQQRSYSVIRLLSNDLENPSISSPPTILVKTVSLLGYGPVPEV